MNTGETADRNSVTSVCTVHILATIIIIIIIITAIELSLGGSSPYTSTDKIN